MEDSEKIDPEILASLERLLDSKKADSATTGKLTAQQAFSKATIKEVCSGISRVRGNVVTVLAEVKLTRNDATRELFFQSFQTAAMDLTQMPDASQASKIALLTALVGVLEGAIKRANDELAELTESAPPARDPN